MGEKKNILYTIPNFKTAGSQFVLLELYKRIDRSLFNPFVLVEKFPDIFPAEISKKEQLFISKAVGKRAYVFHLSTLLKERRIDLVHSWDYKSNSLEVLACRIAGVKYIYTKKNNAWSKRWFIKSLLSTHIVYNNPQMKNRFFSNLLLKNKTTLITHGLDTTIFKPREDTQEKNKFIIGCIAVLNENKNQLLILEALKDLPEAIVVKFYGKAEVNYKTRLNTFIENNDLKHRVSFEGFISNSLITKSLQSLDVVVLASKNEGLPLSIIEAMACGIPVLSSASGGGATYLLNGNQGGFIFKDCKELTKQIKLLYKNPTLKKDLGVTGRKRVMSLFTIQKEVEAYKVLYLSLL